ncbi:amino acid adenylation domain-containing protein [Kibdelosporangium banguiense]|uniref:Amino acid adenylation domain-containing protein n=1 Tax=Kibdelosporangium banguiense TaxID=1365924 RepID=A0ABS4TYB8_9PSEU|nr:non-ribosomal peptide synthetase [Kibdelosporangium banguiense]MBP2329402.1 amino acid adenylation domain-containing protein [Kibdelosporangium banguiense]
MIDRLPAGALVFPASPGQERLWFLDQVNPDADRAYVLAVRVDLRGELDPVALQRAVNTVIDRHEALRTGLRHVDGRLVQVVLQGVTAPLRQVRDARPDDLDTLLRAEAVRPWNLAQPPLVRCLLAAVAPGHHVLLLCVHHAVCDGMSLQVVLDEVMQAHAGNPSAESEAPYQFADYVLWGRDGHGDLADETQAKQHAQQVEFWSGSLRDAPLVLDIPTDHRRPRLQSFSGARLPVTLDSSTTDRLRGWATRAGVTPYTVLLTALSVVLSRASGQDDLIIGLPVANRARPEFARTVGYFANTCPLRVDMRANPSLPDLVTTVQRSLDDVLQHSTLPLGEIVEALSPERSTGRNPVFQVMFGLQQGVQRIYRLPGLVADVSEVDTRAARVDLSLFLFEDENGELAGFLEYADALFDPGTAEVLASALQEVITRILSDSPASVAATPLVADACATDRTNDLTDLPEPPSWDLAWPRVLHYDTQQASRIAVQDNDIKLTYRELAQLMDSAGALLRRAGVRPRDRVAVQVERGVLPVLAMLACWRAGAVYVPIDPRAPIVRTELILAEAQPVAVVTDDPCALPKGLQHLAIPAHSLLHAPSQSTAPVPVQPDAVAYLMFTSGSSGRPKGVAVSHSNLAKFLQAMTARLEMTRRDRMLALTTTAFDISLLELLGTLMVGGSVHVAPASAQREPTELARLLDDPAITLAQATPAAWRMALGAGWRPRHGLRVLCGGEAMSADLADALANGADVLWNLYGPTETTIWSTAARVGRGETVSLGRPLDGTRLLVVDRDLRPIPVGFVGELLIGGLGVAAGYLDRPALTAARFLPDPHGSGQRLYRTGDLVRERHDGTLEFVGRADDQVKVRGHRIELGEVESVLRACAHVSDAAAAIQYRGGEAAVVAYLVADETACTDEHEWVTQIRQTAARVLPASAVPGELYCVPIIPLNPHGKVDRRALAGTGRRIGTVADRVAPRGDVEVKIATMWRDLLEVDEVGVTDDFFALGGHSLLAANLLQSIDRHWGVRVPVADFFVEPTIARLAASLTQLIGEVGTAGAGETGAPPVIEMAGTDDWSFTPVRPEPAAVTTRRAAKEATP